MLIRDFLKEEQHFSRRILKAIKFDGGKVLVNGKPCPVNVNLKQGDELTIQFPEEKIGRHLQAEPMDLDIVYEDEAVMVIHKPAGIATIPSFLHSHGTIANGVLGYYEQKKIPFTVHVVTRLDRDTSGLLLIAKHRYSHSLLSANQKRGNVKRKYLAVVEGRLSETEGTIDANIDRKPGSIIERQVSADGKKAITHYRIIQKGKAHTLLEVTLETGRTHQIRVHFSSIGHPLAGDDLYGGTKGMINRHALHCYELVFQHPFTKKTLVFQSEMPPDMSKFILEAEINQESW